MTQPSQTIRRSGSTQRVYADAEVKGPGSTAPLRTARRKKAQTTAQKANLALRLATRLTKAVELKSNPNALNTTVDDAGRVDQLNAIAQGLTNQTREGDRIKVIRFKGCVVVRNITTPTNDTIVRVILVQGRHELGTAPTWANTYEGAGAHGLIRSTKSFKHRFNTKVLMDEVVTLPPNNDSGISERSITINLPVYRYTQYDGTNTTALHGGFYLFAASNQTGASSPTYILNLWSFYEDA